MVQDFPKKLTVKNPYFFKFSYRILIAGPFETKVVFVIIYNFGGWTV